MWLRASIEIPEPRNYSFEGGFISQAGTTNPLERLKWVFDTNHDGSLSADERTAMVDALEARCEREQLRTNRITAFQAWRAAVVAQFDVNDDGTPDDAEKLALEQAFAHPGTFNSNRPLPSW